MDEEKQKLLSELEMRCRNCSKCELCRGRNNLVFGTGQSDAEIMFIGEGPGEQEDLRGEPFVGKAGILLDKMLAAIDLDRHKNIYIANIVKCRPPQNRDPLEPEQSACIDWLRGQFSIIRPKIIVCLGRIAAMKIIRPDFRITKEHGRFIRKGNVLMTAILHPAALLRYPENKPAAFQDMLDLQEKIREVCTHTYSGIDEE